MHQCVSHSLPTLTRMQCAPIFQAEGREKSDTCSGKMHCGIAGGSWAAAVPAAGVAGAIRRKSSGCCGDAATAAAASFEARRVAGLCAASAAASAVASVAAAADC